MTNWVDLLGDVVWPLPHLENRARNEVVRDFPDWIDLQQQVAQLAAGAGFLDVTTRNRYEAYTSARSAVRAQVVAEVARSALVEQRMAVEDAQYALRMLPPVPDDGPDPDAEARVGCQAIVDSASAQVLDLVAQRNKYPQPEATA